MNRVGTAVVLSMLLLALGLGAPASAADHSEAGLRSRERLKLEKTGRAKRRSTELLVLRDGGFRLFGMVPVQGTVDPQAPAKKSWQADYNALSAIEARVSDWLRADGLRKLAKGAMDGADVEIRDLFVSGRVNRRGTRVKVVVRADLSVRAAADEPARRATYRFRGRGPLADGAEVTAMFEEGWLPGPDEPYWGTYEVRGRHAIVGGDMRLSLQGLRDFQAQAGGAARDAGPDRVARAAIHSADYWWPGGRIPYEIDGAVVSDPLKGEDIQREIEAAIREWNSRTDVQIVERTNETYYVRFVLGTDTRACYADLGRRPQAQQPQEIEIAPGGCGFSTLTHEIGHTVGLRHEQSRPDRNDFVTFDARNLREDSKDFVSQFDIHPYGFGFYDYRSIMHYRLDAAAKKDTNTLEPTRPLPILEPVIRRSGQGLSRGDILAANYLVHREPKLGFAPGSRLWATGLAADAVAQRLGDVDGDGRDDLVTVHQVLDTGRIAVALSQGARFSSAGTWLDDFCKDWIRCLVGDVDGDGLDDVVQAETGHVAHSNGQGFVRSAVHASPQIGGFDRYWLVDVDGDCRDDLVAAIGGGNFPIEVYVSLSLGSHFAPKVWWGDFDGVAPDVADVDGDGRADFVATDGLDIEAHLSDGEAFGPSEDWNPTFRAGGWGPERGVRLADVNGDGRADLVDVIPATAHYLDTRIGLSTGGRFATEIPVYHELDCRNLDGCLFGDVDGDGRPELVDPLSIYEQTNTVREGGDVYVSDSEVILSDFDVTPATTSTTCPVL